MSPHRGQCCSERLPRNASPPMIPVNEEACYPPESSSTDWFVVLHVINARQLLPRSELAPPDGRSFVINENSVSTSPEQELLLDVLVALRSPPRFPEVKEGAPTAATDPIMLSEKLHEVIPCGT